MKTEPNKTPHPTALIVFVRIQAWTPAADGLFVRPKIKETTHHHEHL